ncbi:hypothetical protein [Sphingomonas sp. MMS24-J13]|uniref:hypothetical protein n=1 Tax=Sphingomonas sp. MMS24-J13 TaxID=3238686 RepID=UPI00384C3D85
MAYIDFREAELSGSLSTAFAPRAEPEVTAHASGFSALEWLVVALARRDSLGSLRTPGRIGSALSRIFGGRGEPRLANPRLEALRRFAVFAWHRGHNVPPSELAAFRDAGFSPNQAETVLESILSTRAVKFARG